MKHVNNCNDIYDHPDCCFRKKELSRVTKRNTQLLELSKIFPSSNSTSHSLNPTLPSSYETTSSTTGSFYGKNGLHAINLPKLNLSPSHCLLLPKLTAAMKVSSHVFSWTILVTHTHTHTHTLQSIPPFLRYL